MMIVLVEGRVGKTVVKYIDFGEVREKRGS